MHVCMWKEWHPRARLSCGRKFPRQVADGATQVHACRVWRKFQRQVADAATQEHAFSSSLFLSLCSLLSFFFFLSLSLSLPIQYIYVLYLIEKFFLGGFRG